MTEQNQTSPHYTVLLVDDDRFLLDMYSLKFTQSGHTVQACFSVDEALRALRGGFKADAVVFDIVMPVQDGFALLRTIKEEKLATGAALVALTNQSGEEEARAAELGATGYIVKASTIPSEVVHKIVEAIERQHKA